MGSRDNFQIVDILNIFVIIFCQVEDAVSRAADGTSPVQELDFSSLRAQLGPLPAVRHHVHPLGVFSLILMFLCMSAWPLVFSWMNL